MQVKRYEVTSTLEAMNRIKKDLGPDAIVLSTRKIKKGVRDMFEVMAARDEHTQPFEYTPKTAKTVRPGGLIETDQADALALIHRELQDLKKSLVSCQRQNSLAGELAEVRETIHSFFDALGMRKGRMTQDVSSKLYMKLLGNGFSRAGACRIVDEVNRAAQGGAVASEVQAVSAAAKYIGDMLAGSEKNVAQRRVRMFIGPPGVGKTTTLAKLAARCSIMNRKKIGLVTVDNFRIAAAEQLGAYARIMGLPMESASTKESFAKALEVFADKDVIFVDTPGRARHDDGYLNQFQQALPDNAIEKNLLINATGSEDYLKNIFRGYEHLNIDNIIVTKIDESRRCGILYDLIAKTKKPVRYVTCGQNVPQDIEEATPEMIASLMLDSAMSCTGERPALRVGF